MVEAAKVLSLTPGRSLKYPSLGSYSTLLKALKGIVICGSFIFLISFSMLSAILINFGMTSFSGLFFTIAWFAHLLLHRLIFSSFSLSLNLLLQFLLLLQVHLPLDQS